jgi:uncharacterized protein
MMDQNLNSEYGFRDLTYLPCPIMTAKRWILLGLTLVVASLMFSALIGSFKRAPVRSQLELYQANLLLQASNWQGEGQDPATDSRSLLTIVGKEPVQEALKKYQEVSQSFEAFQTKLAQDRDEAALAAQQTQRSESQLQTTQLQDKVRTKLQNLWLRQGLLEVAVGSPAKAQELWQRVKQQAGSNSTPTADTAAILAGLWSTPPQLLPEAAPILTSNLAGWFQFRSLQQLYQLQQRPDALEELSQQEQQAAETAIFKLTLLAVAPSLGGVIGLVIFLIWLGLQILQLLRARASQPASMPASMSETTSSLGMQAGGMPTIANDSIKNDSIKAASTPRLGLATPPAAVLWGKDLIWQVMVFWFAAFLGLSFTLQPLLLKLGIKPGNDALSQACFSLFSYSLLMFVGLGIIYFSIKPFVPNPLRWLPLKWRGYWFLWSLGGYLAALPLVVLVAALSQKILREQGGSNPILDIILSNQNHWTIVILYLMVAVLAPIFEETLFRGFFLTSLTRYLPPWVAIGMSGGLFAFAHLTGSDLLPLSLLGMVLGYVYLRTGNLLTSILLHSLWNTGSFLGLLVLASAPK